MKNKNILIVDDEERIRTVIKIYLKKDGYDVEEASDGKEALEKCLIKQYDLIILDIMMPEIDGWTICREIRKNYFTPIILLTARSAEYDKLFGFELGADDYITKPFSPKELLARVNAVIRRSQSQEQENNTLQLGKIQIKTTSKQVYIENEITILTPKEFELLYFLGRNEGIAYSREQLLTNVWGYDFFGDLRTVDTHIKQLRAKLGAYKGYIRTVWGIGYMLQKGDNNE